ncbi:hypothetical protein FRB94_010236 [Tulasnella sp. JGI-2019a]|nr:hypothetical protein FRB94_010236 [Tulasnella sp. JGI-2019a]KAG9003150.1 hypothetical protein FRB93_011230 [Tulasnella sp. JGI-2019a]
MLPPTLLSNFAAFLFLGPSALGKSTLLCNAPTSLEAFAHQLVDSAGSFPEGAAGSIAEILGDIPPTITRSKPCTKPPVADILKALEECLKDCKLNVRISFAECASAVAQGIC